MTQRRESSHGLEKKRALLARQPVLLAAPVASAVRRSLDVKDAVAITDQFRDHHRSCGARAREAIFLMRGD